MVMSFFSRECLARHPSPFHTTHVFNQLFSIPRNSHKARNMSSSPWLRATKKPQSPNSLSKSKSNKPASKIVPKAKTLAPAKSLTPNTIASPVKSNLPKYKSFAEQLGEKHHPTLLYQAPSHTLFKLFSYTGGFFCIAYSAYNIYVHYLFPPPDLSKYVVYAFGGIAVFMSGFGTWLFLGPAHMIRTITFIPKRITTSNASSLTRAARTDAHLEIELSKMLPIPFFPARKILATPEEVELSAPVNKPLPSNLTSEERRQIRESEKEELKALQEYEDTHIMTRPFRHFGRGAKSAYKAMARTWLREGFVNAKIKGGNHKLDVTGGWALDGGRALDRLVSVKPRPGASWLL